MDKILKAFFILAPLVAQGIVEVSQEMGVTHGTWALRGAGWLMALALSGRAVVGQQAKNVKAGTDTSGGGA